jgi:hypothetical protein
VGRVGRNGDIRILMQLETKQMLKSRRWRILCVSLLMAAAGFCGWILFDHMSNVYEARPHIPDFGFNNDDILSLSCFVLMLAGIAISAIWSVWVILSVALFYVHQFESKHSRQH